MTKKILPVFVLITLAACLLSYKLGSALIVLAKASTTMQEATEQATPALPAPPAEWVVHGEGLNTVAAATRPAGGAGVQHVVDCIDATLTSYPSTTGGGIINLELLDGSGTIWLQWVLPVASSSGPPTQVSMCGLNIVGNANQSMTLTFQTNTGAQSVELIGHDAT